MSKVSSSTASAATAFVPGHVTAFFSPQSDDDPSRAGSRGAGVTLSDGVRVTVRAVPDDGDVGTRPPLTLGGERLSMPPVETVLDGLGVRRRARVVAESDLPLGTGFGVSGALALGTAIAANDRFGCERSADDLVTLAHRAEVMAGTGLGDVVAQARGGVPIRLAPGAPGHGRLDGVPGRARIEYVTFGDVSTAAVLSGDTEPIRRAGERALERLLDRPTLPELFAASRQFARETGLMTDRLAAVVDDAVAGGGEASMAMLGETAVALGEGLTAVGTEARSCRIHNAGARLVGPTDRG